ncbi:MAG: L-seryl-tRNA(Sec) selenium transferase [Thermomicrobiales bacterium]|nr:L-seryl-tRNA(Sec) selenium transferase [Thermomicrobiales bacterium]
MHTLLADARIRKSAAGLTDEVLTNILRRSLEVERAAILGGAQPNDDLVQSMVAEVELISGARTSHVINGSGVVIQTNLGRAPVSLATARAMAGVASAYVALETDLATGKRGGRGREVEALMRALTGAERTLVVNNNAAAVMLVLATLAVDKQVIVSRGEAVEIGGGFRIPDVLRQSGAHLVEVGTTNRTYARDYAAVINDETAAILRVHASNFAVLGFTARPELSELADLSRAHGVALIEDVGSGCLLATEAYGLDHEPTLGESISAGVDLVCASGDKLLGGPQAGLIMGSTEMVGRVARHPMARALRADKSCLTGIAETLRHYARGEAEQEIPVWWSMSRTADWLEERAGGWAAALGNGAKVVPTQSVVGGGSLPGKTQPSFGIALHSAHHTSDQLAMLLRTGSQPVVPRIIDDTVVVDARTVLATEDSALLAAIQAVLANAGSA